MGGLGRRLDLARPTQYDLKVGAEARVRILLDRRHRKELIRGRPSRLSYFMDFDADYPTKASQKYRDHFLEGCAEGAVVNLDAELVSRAVTSGMGAGMRALDAGKLFATLYVKINKRREFMDKHSRNGVWNPTSYLIAAFEDVLVRSKSTGQVNKAKGML